MILLEADKEIKKLIKDNKILEEKNLEDFNEEEIQ